MTKPVTKSPSFQGDIAVFRIQSIPKDAVRMDTAGQHHVLAHSETGHHHVIGTKSATLFIDKMNAFIMYLDVAESSAIEHLKDFDQHEPLGLTPGKYELHRQQEYIADAWRPVTD